MQLETDRLNIRSFTTADIEAFAAIVADAAVMRYLGGSMTYADTEHYVTRAIDTERDAGFSRYAVELKRNGELVGMCGFAPVEDYIDLGYRFDQRHWGLGFATEAARAVVEDGFAHHGFTEIVGMAHPENSSSIGVLKKLGFTFERDQQTPRGMPAKRFLLKRSTLRQA